MTFSKRTIEKNNKSVIKENIPFITNAVYEKQKAKSVQYTRKSRKPQNKKTFFLWKIFKFVFWFLFDICLIGGIALLAWIFYVSSQAPSLDKINSSSFEQSSVLYDNTGEKILYQFIGDYRREVVTSIDDISIHMRNAMMAAEDANFYEHSGVSIRGILRGVRDSLAGKSSGGSTITQQLIKMTILSDLKKQEKTLKDKIERKIQEITLARKIEKKYSKDEILLLYLNKAPFRGNIYGIEKASKAFFGKSAKDLTIAESALLAGLPQAPGRYQRIKTSYINLPQTQIDALNIINFTDLISRQQSGEISYRSFVRGMFGTEYTFANGATDYIPGRADYVLNQMVQKNFISEAEFNKATQELKTLEIKEFKDIIQAPHFTFHAQDELRKILKDLYGLDSNAADVFLHKEGLKITTTIDLKLNNEVQRIISENGEKAEAGGFNIRNAAGLVLDSKTGAILAMVGSRDFYAKEINGNKFDGEVNVITSIRQPGSTYKPLAYAAAFELKGLSPATILMDVETNLSLNKAKKYTPRNYDGTFSGPVSIRQALGRSLNIPAVKAGIIVGIKEFIAFTQKIGIVYQEDVSRFGPAMALGAPTIRPLDIGSVFATFANNGKKVEAYAIESITSADGNILYSRSNIVAQKKILQEEFNALSKNNKLKIENIQKNNQVLSEATSFLITSILSDETGTARPKSWNKFLSLPERPSAAKTGTSTGVVNGITHPHDVWTIGYTPQRTALVWMGNNNGWKENPFGLLHDKASGLTNAAIPWRDIMIEAHKDLDVEEFKKPDSVKKIAVSTLTGKIPPSEFPSKLIRSDFFNVNSLPSKQDTSFKIVRLEKESQLLPNEFTPESVIEEFTYIEFHSFFPENKEWESAVKRWIQNNGLKLAKSYDIPNLIPFVPEEYTNIYSKDTKENAPQISILSPSNMGIVSPPMVNVTVDVRAKNKVKSVNLLWDGTLIATKTSSPWIFTIPLHNAQIGSLHLLEAKITDSLNYTDITSVNVKVGEDSLPPEITILYPQSGEKIEKNSLVQIAADAVDKNSSIKKVQFFIDGTLTETKVIRPYQFSWNANISEGSHTLKAIAFDSAGNKKTQSLNFSIITSEVEVVQRETSVGENANTNNPTTERVLAITAPQDGTEFTSAIPITFSIPTRMRTSDFTVSVMARKKSGKKEKIFSISGDKIPKNGLSSFSWTPSKKGEYAIYLQTQGTATDFSSKVNIIAK